MPAAPTQSDTDPDIRKGSFADAAGSKDEPPQDDSDAQAAETAAAASEAQRVAAEKSAQDQKAASDAAAKAEADRKAKSEPEKPANANPHLDDETPPAPKVDLKDEEVPHGMTGKAAETWKSLKQTAREAAAALVPLQTEVEDMKKQLAERDKSAPEIEALRKQNEDLAKQLADFESEIAIGRIEATQKYKSDVTAPIKSAEDVAKAIATKYELSSPTELLEALRETDENKRADALSEIARDFKPYDSKRLFDAADAYAKATKIGEELRKDASAKLERLTEEQKQERNRELTLNSSNFRKAVSEEFKAMQEKFPILRAVEGRDDWNKYLTSIREGIESVDVNDLPVDEVARAFTSHRILPEIDGALKHFRSMADKERKARIAAEEKLEAFKGATPGAGGGHRGEPHGGSAPGAKSGSFVDAVSEEE